MNDELLVSFALSPACSRRIGIRVYLRDGREGLLEDDYLRSQGS